MRSVDHRLDPSLLDPALLKRLDRAAAISGSAPPGAPTYANGLSAFQYDRLVRVPPLFSPSATIDGAFSATTRINCVKKIWAGYEREYVHLFVNLLSKLTMRF
eukprot:2495787-Pyramimonas_sp.AAC.1